MVQGLVRQALHPRPWHSGGFVVPRHGVRGLLVAVVVGVSARAHDVAVSVRSVSVRVGGQGRTCWAARVWVVWRQTRMS